MPSMEHAIPLHLRLLVYSTLLAWVMLLTASMLRVRGYTPAGMKIAFGNRDDVPDASPIVARADRAAANMLENLLLFAALLLAAHVAGVPKERLELPARLFFYARVLYFPVYLAGIPYLRTLVWTVGVVALAMIASTMLTG